MIPNKKKISIKRMKIKLKRLKNHWSEIEKNI
jgi:hypothetical protein